VATACSERENLVVRRVLNQENPAHGGVSAQEKLVVRRVLNQENPAHGGVSTQNMMFASHPAHAPSASSSLTISPADLYMQCHS
jgi:hypothetical protein